jgi:hypothetical protein
MCGSRKEELFSQNQLQLRARGASGQLVGLQHYRVVENSPNGHKIFRDGQAVRLTAFRHIR